MVDSIEGQIAELQAGEGAGTATQYVEPIPTPTPTPTPTCEQVTLLKKLPMAPRTKLKMIAIKYAAEDCSLENAGDFADLFDAIRASINSQRIASATKP